VEHNYFQSMAEQQLSFQVCDKAAKALPYLKELKVSRMWVDDWLREDTDAIWAALHKNYGKSNHTVTCIALMHKIQTDPMGTHKKPVVLDYIFTNPICRRQGYALAMIQDLKHLTAKTEHGLTAFCDSSESECLFEKAGFMVKDKGNLVAVARYP
jgi:hypothetical protein